MAATASSIRTYNSPRLVARHAAILTAAREELAEKGFAGLTMNELATRAGVTKKTLYNVYGSKDKLITAAISDLIANYREAGTSDEPGIPAIIASRRAAIKEVLASPAYSDAMTSALFQVDADPALTRMLLADSITFTEEQLKIEQQNGGLSPNIDTWILAQQITSQAWGQILLCYKNITPMKELERGSLTGLLLLLQSASQGQRQCWVIEQFEQLNDSFRRS